jgi:hypothetical protein
VADPIIKPARYGLGPASANAFAQSTLDADYLSASGGIVMPAAMTVVAIINCTATEATRGTIIQCLRSGNTIGFTMRINPATPSLDFGCFDSTGSFKEAAYTHAGIVGGGTVFAWGTYSGTTIRSGVGRPADITPASNTLGGAGAKTGAVGDPLDLFDWNGATERSFAGTISIVVLDELLSDATLNALGAAMSLKSVRGQTPLIEPRPTVRAGIEIASQVRDSAGLTWAAATQTAANTVVSARI